MHPSFVYINKVITVTTNHSIQHHEPASVAAAETWASKTDMEKMSTTLANKFIINKLYLLKFQICDNKHDFIAFNRTRTRVVKREHI